MKVNTRKFLDTYNRIGEIEFLLNESDTFIPMKRRIELKIQLKRLNKNIHTYANELNEYEFNNHLADLCINTYEDFKEAYNIS